MIGEFERVGCSNTRACLRLFRGHRKSSGLWLWCQGVWRVRVEGVFNPKRLAYNHTLNPHPCKTQNPDPCHAGRHGWRGVRAVVKDRWGADGGRLASIQAVVGCPAAPGFDGHLFGLCPSQLPLARDGRPKPIRASALIRISTQPASCPSQGPTAALLALGGLGDVMGALRQSHG